MSVAIDDVERDLEFDDIRGLVADECRSAQGREIVLTIGPFRHRAEAEAELDGVAEMRRVLAEGHRLPFYAVLGPAALQRLGLTGAVLDVESLCDLRATLRNLGDLKRGRDDGVFAAVPILQTAIDGLVYDDGLLRELERVLDDDGTVRESASPELRLARRRQADLKKTIEGQLEGLMRDERLKDCFGDTYVTTMNDRYVIPVINDFKGRVGGVVQGASGSGHSVFLEPFKVVEQNNDLLEARARERAEIVRLLLALSDRARLGLDDLRRTVKTLSWLDGVHARAVWASRTASVRPSFAADDAIRLRRARHPLLGDECIPMDLEVAGEQRVVVLSGANSGGKTVTLKTVGLCCLMARCGFHVPADEGTVVPFCKRVFVEIGDQQSIAEHLSSFSSHARNVAAIMQRAQRGDLVLLDELMSGTDPEEGAALAEAVVDELGRRGCLVVTTTHYGQLKVLSQQSALYKNCAVEFDGDTYRPTYRLISDMPGASYGFEIARRFGLSGKLVDRAKAMLGGGRHRLTELIEDLETELRRVREAAQERERELAQAEALRAELEAREKAFKAERQQRLTDELERLRGELLDFRKDVERRLSGVAPAADERRDIVRSADVLLKKYRPPQPEPTDGDRPLRVGERVKIEGSSMTGRITDVNDGRGVVRVDTGGMVVTVRMDEVVPVGGGAEPRRRKGGGGLSVTTTYESERPYEIDVRGMRAHEAVEELERMLDLAVARSVDSLRVIHGKGTGTLRREVERILRQTAVVKSFRMGGEGEGDFGVTVVTLK